MDIFLEYSASMPLKFVIKFFVSNEELWIHVAKKSSKIFVLHITVCLHFPTIQPVWIRFQIEGDSYIKSGDHLRQLYFSIDSSVIKIWFHLVLLASNPTIILRKVSLFFQPFKWQTQFGGFDMVGPLNGDFIAVFVDLTCVTD